MICIDVTELLNVDYISGIQRVVKEVTVRWIERKEELLLLKYDTQKNWFWIVDSIKFYQYYIGKLKKKKLLSAKKMKISEFGRQHIFFDMDSVWMNPLKRSYLLPALKEQGVKLAAHIYDVIPVTEAVYCHAFTTVCFMEYLGAQLKYADLIITNAHATVDALKQITEGTDAENIHTAVVKLGSDMQQYKSGQKVRDKIKKIPEKGAYILMVGTLEPRKNHKFILNAFDQKLFADELSLVFAGRIGWNIESFVTSVKEHCQFGRQLFLIEDATDEEISFLYKHTLAVAFPSYNEGFGLPVIEAIHNGAIVLAADIPVLHEAGGEFCRYFSLEHVDEFIDYVQTYRKYPKTYSEDKEKLNNYKSYTWDDCAAKMLRILKNGGDR